MRLVEGPTPYEVTRQLLEAGRTSCEHITEEYLHRVEEKQRLNAFLSVLPEKALAQARAVDQKLAAGTAGPLAGMVVAVKDALSLRGERLTCASRILEQFTAVYTATAVERLIEADAVVVGKTNMDEFAMGSSSENSAFGPVLNPVDEHRVPGGSSSGSCVAVAAGMAHAALGHGHRRLDTAAGCLLRCGRSEANLRTGLAVWACGHGLFLRPDRPVRPYGPGRSLCPCR